MEEKKYLIYIHTNKTTGKKYVGQTSLAPEVRWGKNGIGYKKHFFYKAIQEYGWDNFTHEIIERDLTNEQADQREKYWIAYYNTLYPNGYNRLSGGGGISEHTRIRMKNSWTQELREEKRQLTTQLNKTLDRTGSNNSMYGKTRTGKNAGNKKRVQCIETQMIFETVSDASRWCNNGKDSLKSHITQQIQGKRKSCGKHPLTKEKLHWRYI